MVGVDLGDRVDLASRAGADTVIDAGSVDFTRTGDRYDVIIDIPGNHRFSDCRRALTSDGVYVLIGHDAFGAHGGRWLGSLRRFAGLLVRTPFSPHLQPSFSAPPKPGTRCGTWSRDGRAGASCSSPDLRDRRLRDRTRKARCPSSAAVP